MSRLAAWWAFFRFKDWYFVTGIALLGFLYRIAEADPLRMLLVLLSAALFLAHGYGFNNYFDLREEPRPAPAGLLGSDLRAGLYLSLIFLVASVSLAALCSIRAAAALAAGGLVGFLYSSSWTRLKCRPFWNLVLNSTGFSLLFVAGYFFNKKELLPALWLSSYLWLAIIPLQIIHLLSHAEVEHNWPFSAATAMKVHYAAQAAWVLVAAGAGTFCFDRALPLPLLTTVFCLVQHLIIAHERRGRAMTSAKATSIRSRLRLAVVVFGVLLVALFALA